MTANRAVIGGAMLWILTAAGGLVHWLILDGDSAGGWAALGALLVFLFWQAAALGVAVLVLIVRVAAREGVAGAARWVGFVPIALSGAFAVFVLVVYLYAMAGPG